MRELAELTHRLQELAEEAETLADDLELVNGRRTELRDLLQREFVPDIATAGSRLWLETVIDDILELVADRDRSAARDLATALRRVVMSDGECLDCGADTYELGEYYMLERAIWLEAHPYDEGMLCIGCVEERLGRRLGTADFLDLPMNRGPHTSSRLRARVLGIEEAPAA